MVSKAFILNLEVPQTKIMRSDLFSRLMTVINENIHQRCNSKKFSHHEASTKIIVFRYHLLILLSYFKSAMVMNMEKNQTLSLQQKSGKFTQIANSSRSQIILSGSNTCYVSIVV